MFYSKGDQLLSAGQENTPLELEVLEVKIGREPVVSGASNSKRDSLTISSICTSP